MQLAPIDITSQPSQPIVLGTLFDKSKSKSSDHDLILFPFFADAGATRFLLRCQGMNSLAPSKSQCSCTWYPQYEYGVRTRLILLIEFPWKLNISHTHENWTYLIYYIYCSFKMPYTLPFCVFSMLFSNMVFAAKYPYMGWSMQHMIPIGHCGARGFYKRFTSQEMW